VADSGRPLATPDIGGDPPQPDDRPPRPAPMPAPASHQSAPT
jgi:hypothetical protein